MTKSLKEKHSKDLEEKIAYLLQGTAILFLLMVLRIWYVSVWDQETLVKEAKKPTHKVVYTPAKRGTIRDRFNKPLAMNQLNYQAAVVWADMAALPKVVFDKDPETGQKIKRFYRKEYIEKLSLLLGRILQTDPLFIEDQIWSTASFYGQAPFVLKEGIDEATYYQLVRLQTFWPGILPIIGSKRCYPAGKVACDVLGYMGAIDAKEYGTLFHELRELEDYLQNHLYENGEPYPQGLESLAAVEEKRTRLQEKAYTTQDVVGKSGVEKTFETSLRGVRGKHTYEADAKGHFLKELPGGNNPQSGQRLLLTLSRELQEYAEELLAFVEQEASLQPLHAKQEGQTVSSLTPPWIKGGAIVALDPNNGDVLALASHPRFDPNDFVPHLGKKSEKERIQSVGKWLELDRYLELLWNEQLPLEREHFDPLTRDWHTEEAFVTWPFFLERLFLTTSTPREWIQTIDTLEKAVTTLTFLETPKEFDDYQEKLSIDLLRLLVEPTRFTKELLLKVGHFTLADYKTARGQYLTAEKRAEELVKQLFHENLFLPWRKQEGKAFLKEKRLYEKEHKLFAKPYLEYFAKEEARQFQQFWQEHKSAFVLAHLLGSCTFFDQELTPYFEALLAAHTTLPSPLKEQMSTLDEKTSLAYISTFLSLADLEKEKLFATVKGLRHPSLKGLALSFYPRYGFGYGRSYAYRQSSVQGSIFKVVTAFSALRHRYNALQEEGVTPTEALINNFSIFDQVRQVGDKWVLGRWQDGSWIPQLYKGGRLPRSLNYNIGTCEVIRALETSSNPYFSLLAADHVPLDEYLQTIASLSYGNKTGIALPGEISGALPTDLAHNPTGLYATAIGQHTLVVTPLQTAVMLATLANGGSVFVPRLAYLGIQQGQTGQEVLTYPEVVKEKIEVPPPVQSLLFQGMKKVLTHAKAGQLRKYYPNHFKLLKQMEKRCSEIAAKTSTSEAIERLSPGLGQKPFQVNHVWGGGISFCGRDEEGGAVHLTKDAEGKPELVVVVYLRFGRLGKQTLPLVALLREKWRELQEREKNSG